MSLGQILQCHKDRILIFHIQYCIGVLLYLVIKRDLLCQVFVRLIHQRHLSVMKT